MIKTLQLSATFVILALVLAACPGDGGGAASPEASPADSPEGTAAASPEATEDGTAQDPETVCAEDEFGCAEYAEGEPIRLGLALSLTGDTAFLGLDSQYGVQIAIDERGQVAGHDVEVVPEDAGCGQAESGQTAASALAADETIVAAIGTTCSRTAVPAAPILGEAGILLISSSNTAPSLTNPEHEDYGGEFYARTAHNDEVQGAAMASFACEVLEVTRAATIHDGSPYAQQLQQVFADEFQAQCDGEITAQEAINVGETQFGPVLSRIAETEPELLYYPIFDPEGGLIARQVKDTPGLAETATMAAADGLITPTFLQDAGEAAEGMYLSGPDLEYEGEYYENEFLPAYQELSGEEDVLAAFHAHAYDAANMLFDAIEEVAIQGDDGTTYIPRQALRDAFFGTQDYAGLTGTLSCNEFGDCGAGEISVSQVQGGEFVKVWPED